MVEHLDESTPNPTDKLETATPPGRLSSSAPNASEPGSGVEAIRWEEEFIEFVVAVVRLLLIAGVAAFRLGAHDFGQAISSAAIGDTLRTVAQDIQQAVVDINTTVEPQTVHLRRSHLPDDQDSPPVTVEALAQDEVHSESPIVVSRGARVGVFRNSIEAAPFITGVSNAVSRACDTYEDACGAFFYALDRGLVVAIPASKPPVAVTTLNVAALSKMAEPLVVGFDTSLKDMPRLLTAYHRLVPKKFYVVIVGLRTGVYREWLEVGFYVQGVPGMNYRVFDDETQAEYAFNEALISDIVKVIPDCQLGHRLPII